MRLRERGQGWTDSQMIISLMLLNLAGGESVSDLDLLEKDVGLCKMLGEFETCGMRRRERRALEKRWRVERRRRVPSESAVFRYLERFHDVDEESKREAHRAFIAAPNKALEGLGKVNADVVGFVQSRSPHTEATLDMDATLVETRKQEALYSYKKYRAYQPLITYWSTFKEYGRTLEKIRVGGGETLTRSRRRSRRCWWRSTRGRATPWDRTPG